MGNMGNARQAEFMVNKKSIKLAMFLSGFSFFQYVSDYVS